MEHIFVVVFACSKMKINAVKMTSQIEERIEKNHKVRVCCGNSTNKRNDF